jgi:putative tryptophan/tyrosine transport system substrate-binding protein
MSQTMTLATITTFNRRFRGLLPLAATWHPHIEDGGLAFYGIDFLGMLRGAAAYVDRILKGEKPADLPVQAPTNYKLVINLKAAKALGLDIPPIMLTRADEVIE